VGKWLSENKRQTQDHRERQGNYAPPKIAVGDVWMTAPHQQARKQKSGGLRHKKNNLYTTNKQRLKKYLDTALKKTTRQD